MQEYIANVIVTMNSPMHDLILTWARFLSLAQNKLWLCSAIQRLGYWSNLSRDWLSTAWAHSEQEAETGPGLFPFCRIGIVREIKSVCDVSIPHYGNGSCFSWRKFATPGYKLVKPFRGESI